MTTESYFEFDPDLPDSIFDGSNISGFPLRLAREEYFGLQ